jgi:hypothetical protein
LSIWEYTNNKKEKRKKGFVSEKPQYQKYYDQQQKNLCEWNQYLKQIQQNKKNMLILDDEDGDEDQIKNY